MASRLHKVNSSVIKKFKPELAPGVGHFVRSLFEKATPDLLEQFSEAQLSNIARAAIEYIQKRKPDQVLARAYNPTEARHGWQAPYTVVEICLTDRPFIVDSLRASLGGQGLKLVHLLHPILELDRDPEGELLLKSIGRSDSSLREAYELFLIERIEDSKQIRALQKTVREVLADVVLATDDYRAMKAKADEVRQHLSRLETRLHQLATLDGIADLQEYADFMRWLDDDNYVYLGYREYDIAEHKGKRSLSADKSSALGILRKMKSSTYHQPVPLEDIPRELRERVTSGALLLVTKSNAESTVHRPARMDYIGVKKFDSAGQAAGERRFLGLFTSKAHSTRVDQIPILRRKLKQVVALDDAVPGSHDFKQMVTIFNSMPREELFWSPAEQLHRDIRTIMSIERERGVRVTVRPDPLKRGLALMVIMPRERFNSEVRTRIQDLLTERLQATHVDYNLAMGEDEAQVRFHFFFITDLNYESLDLAALNREVAQISRTWDDQLQEDLEKLHERSQAGLLLQRYAGAFDQGYKEDNSAATAISDIVKLEALESERYRVALVNPERDNHLRLTTYLKIYHQQPTLVLSEVFPILENLGLQVVEQISYPVSVGRNKTDKPPIPRGIDVFRVLNATGQRLPSGSDGDHLREAVHALLLDEAENDRLNHLVVGASLTVHQVALLRTYRGYLSQLQAARSRSFITETLLSYPTSARAIYSFFEAKFSGLSRPKRKLRMETARNDFDESLNAVASLTEDATLRALLQLVEATVRTNFFLDKKFISLKIESAEVLEMPEPRPLYEIVVNGPNVEGIHLRGGMVARGGLRWSDRPDDFRTEVLGLMKTQMTKNAVIVPVGSKGGFVLKRAPTGRAELAEFVEEQYKTFVRGLLDLTDNIVDGEVVHPPGLHIYDGPDPYLVVAADKGTATFSDIANEISQEYRFWLGDAFASGGSYGYDHKKEGITARGAWECVARHFREMDVNVLEESFTAIGIGDMSGDVFGNGMLYTKTVRLIAAFNHQHIFIDPDPNVASAYKERKRLFAMTRSNWSDYNSKLISKGGGVFPRDAKSITLTPELKRLLGTTEEALSGQAIVKRLLVQPVDLLWNGGIGTYVKSTGERNAEVGDSANDAVRVDATQIQARVVGEGGNLGFTQLARIEYCLAGGRMNTDAIDNSAGVDMSDHEVNIKILLQPLMRRRRLSFVKRNELLKKMTSEVNALVLRDNYSQSLCLSLAERASRRDLEPFQSLLGYLIDRENLKRHVEFLPDSDQLEERRRSSKGFTRPELAILLAYTKMGLSRYLLETELPDEPHLQHYLIDYFPRALGRRYKSPMKEHSLRREIIACQITNVVVDRLGMDFVHSSIHDTAATPEEVTRAALAALEILDLNNFWQRIFDLDNRLPAKRQYEALEEVTQAVSGIVQWILLAGIPIDQLSKFVSIYREPLLKLRKNLADVLPVSERKRFEQNRSRVIEGGFPEGLAGEITALEYLTSGMGVIDVSRVSKLTLEEAAKHFYAIGDRLALGHLRDGITALNKTSKWDRIAAGGLIMDLRQVQRQLTIGYEKERRAQSVSITAFLARFPQILKRFDQALWDVRANQALDLTSAGVLTRLLMQIAEKSSIPSGR